MIKVEVFDAQLNYNLFLGLSWTYAMSAVVSSLFRMIQFPHKGKFVKVDQLSYYTLDPNSTGSIPFVEKMNTLYEDISVGLFKDSSLMGTFVMPPPNFPSNFSKVNMITSSTMESSNLWIVPLEFELSSYGNEMPFSPHELAYQAVQSFSDPSSFDIDQVDMINDDYSPLSWLEPFSLSSHFHCMFPIDERIMKVMTSNEMTWNDHHHCSSFLLGPNKNENYFSIMF